MTSNKLTSVLKIITDNLTIEQIPYSLIGALALNLYGLPRYTADIDLLTEGRYWSLISPLMKRLGYTCYQKTDSFAQFDSEMRILGKIDFMFVNTQDGKDINKRSIVVKDELMGNHPVIQPTDYIILKLMAIANNPERGPHDEGDILSVMKLYRDNVVPKNFDPLNKKRIYQFADRFGQLKRFKSCLERIFGDSDKRGEFRI